LPNTAPSLTELDADGFSVANINGLSQCTPNLDRIFLGRNPNLTDVAELSRMNQLTFVDLLLATGIDSLVDSGLSQVASLHELNLKQTSVHSLVGAESLTSLSRLTVSNTAVESLSPLSGLPLQRLDISHTAVSSTSGAPSTLVELIANSSPVSNVDSVALMSSLNLANFNNTGVVSAVPFASSGLSDTDSLSVGGTTPVDCSNAPSVNALVALRDRGVQLDLPSGCGLPP
jgi:hypothetical protein